MPKEMKLNPEEMNLPAHPAPRPSIPAGNKLRVVHDYVDFWPRGHVIAQDELPAGVDVKRLIALGAVEWTDDPGTGKLNASEMPPGAAVYHQLTPGEEVPAAAAADQPVAAVATPAKPK